MKQLTEKLRALWNDRSMGFKVFFLALVTAILMFVPAIIEGKGYFMVVGDFNSQQIPFYQHAHDAVRAGQFGWDCLTDLGSNFITSYTFYLLGSPFFWLTVPFPSAAVPYLMGPLLILKTSLCALFAFLWLRHYVKNPWYAAMGGFLYAFCGFALYNIFFNHFHDVMVFFPLLLLAVDELADNEVHGAVAGMVALCALVNYFFFFGEVVFVVIYYFTRICMKGYKRSWKRFGLLALESVLGLLIAGVLVAPSVVAILKNERLDNPLSGTNLWVFGKSRLMAILASYLFPPEFTSKQVFVDGAGTRWSSLSAYIPVFGLTGVFCFFRTKRDHWLKTLIMTLMVMSVVPVLNSAFVAFNASYYARWFYMPVLCMILATVISLEEGSAADLKKANRWVLALTLGYALILLLTPNFTNKEFTDFGLFNKEFKIFFLFLTFLALVLWLASRFLISERGLSEKRFLRSAVATVLAFGVLFGNFYIFWGKSLAYSTNGYMIPVIEGRDEIDLPDREADNYRIDTDNSLSNLGMFWGLQNMHCFHSIVPASIVDFYEFIGEERSVNSKPPESQYAIRSLLSVRWYFDRTNCSDSFGSTVEEDPVTLMPGYRFYDLEVGYAVWENKYYIPMGFVYDTYTTQEDFDNVPRTKYGNLMLRGVFMKAAQYAKYTDILEHASYTSSSRLDESSFFEDCLDLRKKTVDTFEYTKKGFRAVSSFAEDEFVFFSVPWEEGWSATVNGEPAEIEKVNVGFMALRVPAGDSEIVFTYRTPGLRTGLLMTAAGILGLAAYLAVAWRKTLKKLYVKYKEPALYVLFGVGTTLLNWGTYVLCTRLFHWEELTSNALAWLAGTLFAFVTNKLYVFESKSWEPKTAGREFVGFMAARAFSLLVDEGIMALTVKVMKLPDIPMKLLSNLVVIAMNYVFSKLVIFRKGKKTDGAGESKAGEASEIAREAAAAAEAEVPGNETSEEEK